MTVPCRRRGLQSSRGPGPLGLHDLAGFLEEISESIQRGRFGGGASDLHPLGFNFIPPSY